MTSRAQVIQNSYSSLTMWALKTIVVFLFLGMLPALNSLAETFEDIRSIKLELGVEGEVFLNGKSVGFTDENGTLNIGMPPIGDHEVELRVDGEVVSSFELKLTQSEETGAESPASEGAAEQTIPPDLPPTDLSESELRRLLEGVADDVRRIASGAFSDPYTPTRERPELARKELAKYWDARPKKTYRISLPVSKCDYNPNKRRAYVDVDTFSLPGSGNRQYVGFIGPWWINSGNRNCMHLLIDMKTHEARKYDLVNSLPSQRVEAVFEISSTNKKLPFIRFESLKYLCGNETVKEYDPSQRTLSSGGVAFPNGVPAF